jgi:hypothetical protein
MKDAIAVILGRMLLMLLVFLTVGSCGVLAQPGGALQRANRPAAIWASGPLEVIAAFPESVGPNRAKVLIGQSIPYFDSIEPDKGAAQSVAYGASGGLLMVVAHARGGSSIGRSLGGSTMSTSPVAIHSRAREGRA